MDFCIHKKTTSEIQAKVECFALLHNYPLESLKTQRILGPRVGAIPPVTGSEVFVQNIPQHLFEYELMPIFSKDCRIYKFRLMISDCGLTNRGFAYITYQSQQEAEHAIVTLNKLRLSPNTDPISVKKSIDNRRLFVGGIPDHKSKDQIWREITRAGIVNVVDVIMYRSYTDRNKNRGFVFVEFETHNDAAVARIFHKKSMQMFGQHVYVDWSTPLREVDDHIMDKVTKLFISNLNVLQSTGELRAIIENVLQETELLDKVYKHRDYAFVHFKTRRGAQKGMALLKAYYETTTIEVTWAKPPSHHPGVIRNADINEKPSSPHCCQHSAAAALSEERRRRTQAFTSLSHFPSSSVSPESSGTSGISHKSLDAPGPSTSQLNHIDYNTPISHNDILAAFLEEWNI